jgi:NAD(P)H-flavin reductase/ferredoxin
MNTHAIALNTRDDQHVRFECGEAETLLDAAARASIVLPSECKSGGCGACRVTCRDGDTATDPCSDEALPPEARRRGDILLCRTRPRSPLTLDAPFDHGAIGFFRVPLRAAAIAEIEDIGGNVRRLVLQLTDDDDLGCAAAFEPGQFMELDVPGQGLRRAYSLANTGNWDGRLEFLVRLHPAGRFSTWLRTTARIGDPVQVHGPQGRFTLREESLRPRYLVAGGTGIAPMLSMLRHMAELQDTTPAHVFFGVNRVEDLFALDSLERLQADLPGLGVTICVWQADSGWRGFAGTPVDALRERLARRDANADIYVCGPPQLIHAAEATARAAGIPDVQVFGEIFVPAAL